MKTKPRLEHGQIWKNANTYTTILVLVGNPNIMLSKCGNEYNGKILGHFYTNGFNLITNPRKLEKYRQFFEEYKIQNL